MVFPQWFWFVLEVLIVPIIAFILENKFSIIQRITRLFYLLFNKEAGIDLTLWIETEDSFSSMKNEIKKILDKDIEKVKKDTPKIYELKLKTFNLTLREHNSKIYIFETDRIRAGIRDVKKDLRFLVDIISKLRSKEQIKNIANVSLNLYLPYKWTYVKTLNPHEYELKDYEINLQDKRYKSIVNLNIQRINFKNANIEQLTDILGDFTKIF